MMNNYPLHGCVQLLGAMVVLRGAHHAVVPTGVFDWVHDGCFTAFLIHPDQSVASGSCLVLASRGSLISTQCIFPLREEEVSPISGS